MSLNSEQRQHINLSNYAYNIITEDAFTFFWNDNISGIINKILLNSWETSEASLDLAAKIKRDSLIQQLKKQKADSEKLSSTELYIIELLTKEYINELQDKIKKYPKEKTLKIRLNNKVNEIFYSEHNIPNNIFYPSQCDYIKAILEDYALKSYSEREAILFSDHIEKLEDHLDADNKRLLLITFKSLRGNTHQVYFKPYRFSKPAEDNYLYITGLSKFKDNPSAEYKPISYRISRIIEIKKCAKSMGSGRLTKDEEKLLEKAITTNGIEFLVNEALTIKVRLSDYGKRIFNTLSHLRPHVDNIEDHNDGSSTYTFHCTQFQAQNYFVSFGKDAIILEPSSAAEAMADKYREASDAYSRSK